MTRIKEKLNLIYGKFIEESGVKIRQYLMSETEILVNFEGMNSIDAQIFTKTIDETIVLLKESATSHDPDCIARLEIKANREGSFEAIFSFLVDNHQSIFSRIITGRAVVKRVIDWMKIKKHLKDEKPKSIKKSGEEDIVIKNNQNKNLVINKKSNDLFFKDNKIENSIINLAYNFQISERESLTFKSEDQKFSLNQEECKNFKTHIVDDLKKEKIVKEKNLKCDLLIRKPDLLQNSNWSFKFMGQDINAKIEDQEFLDKLHSRKIKNMFTGVKLPCVLQVEYKEDEYGNLVPNSYRYTVLEVTGDLIEPENDDDQLTMSEE